MPCSHICQLPEPGCWFSSTVGDTKVPKATLLSVLVVVVFHEVEYGGAVTSGPAFTPSTRNWTPATPTSSEAVAVTLVVPPTFAPGSGDVMLTVGAAGEETPRNRLSRFAVMRWMRGSTVPARSSPQLQLVVPAPNTQAPLGAW